MRCLACSFESAPGMSYCGRCGAPLPGARPATDEPTPDTAELRQLTVLSCGLVGVADLEAEALRQEVAGFQAAAKELVERFDGYVAQNTGDGLVVYFGYPKAHDDDARRALHVGFELVAAAAGGRPPAARAGVSTGSAVTGPVAGRLQLALGTVPHEAASLMKLAEPGTLLLAADTRRLARGAFLFEELGAKTLEDLSRPLDVFRLLRPVDADALRPSAGGLGPLIGRHQELALLVQRFDEAREGHGQLVLVAGEPGIGKTHLVRTFAGRLAEGGSPCLECWCSPYETHTPLAPFVRLVRTLAATGAAGSPDLTGLAALARRAALPPDDVVPLFAELASVPLAEPFSPLGLTPGAQRKRTLEALVDLLVGLADEPLAFVAEDLHWADPSALELFDLLVARGRDARLLTILTFRPELEPPWGLLPGMTHLPLSPLSRREAGELIDAAVEGAELPPGVRDEISRRAGGVPLFLQEITRTTVHEAETVRRGGAGGARLQDIPATLQESLAARLDRLGSAKAVAQQAAVLGSSFSLELLAAVSPVGEAALVAELDRLVTARLLQRSGSGWRSRYQFRHALLREMAYRSLLEGDRRRLHTSAVRAIDERFPDIVDQQPELAAHHATEAGLTERAVELWQRAGRRAFEQSANAEAIAHFRQALELVGALPAGEERDRRELSLLTDLGPALITARGYGTPEVEEAYLRADGICRRVDDPEERLRVLKGLHTLYFVRAEFGKAFDNVLSMGELAARSELQGVELQYHESSGALLLFGGDFTDAREHLKVADALTRSRAPAFSTIHELRTLVLSEDGLALWHLGYPERALERHRQAVARARQIGQAFNMLFALHLGVWLRQLRCEPREVAAAARELWARASELELPYLSADGDVFLGWALACGARSSPGARAGPTSRDADEAVRRLRRGVAGLESVGMRMGTTYRQSLLADACLRLGRLEEAAAALTEATAAAEASGEGFRRAEIHRLRGELLLAERGEDAFAKAEEAFRSALETARGQRAKSLELRAAVSLGRLWQTLGRPVEARELVAEVYGWFTEGSGLPDLVAARELLDELSRARCS